MTNRIFARLGRDSWERSCSTSRSFRWVDNECLIRLCDTSSCYALVKRLQFYVVSCDDRISSIVQERSRVQIRATIRQLRQRGTMRVGENHQLQVRPPRE